MGRGVSLSSSGDFLIPFTESHEPTVLFGETKCMRVVINANASGTEECTGTAVKGNLELPVILP